jgi:hypothetical protein
MTRETSNERALELEVLDFDAGNNDSYLCLGAANLSVTHGSDLRSRVEGFVDDERDRGANDGATADAAASLNHFHTLSQTERQTESNALHTKGGWRDHTDGNRITTTRGDKVEVIRGNYKLVVLGREQWNNDTGGNDYGAGLHYESSGGITYHYDEVPGQYVDIRWEYDDDTQTWRCIEECTKGHNVSRYHGVHKEWMTGGDVVTRIGSLAAYDKQVSSSTPSEGDSDDFITDPHFDKPNDAAHQTGAWPSNDTLPDVSEEVWATSVKERAIAKTIECYLGSDSRWLESCSEKSNVTDLLEENYYKNYELKMQGGRAHELWIGAFYFELFLGINSTSKLGFFFDCRLGAMVTECNLVGIAELNATVLRFGYTASLVSFLDYVAAPRTLEFKTGAIFGVSCANTQELKMTEQTLCGYLSHS